MIEARPILILKPISGLGNRIRAISSFIYLKNLIGADLQVIWQPDRTLNADFDYLFQPNPSFSLLRPSFKYRFIITQKRLVNNKFGLISQAVKAFNGLIMKVLSIDALFLHNDVSNLAYVKRVCSSSRRIVIITNGQCIEYPEGVRSFVPVDPIASIINNNVRLFKKRMIGMHIRRTDHVISIKNSPLFLFEDKIHAYLGKYNDIGVFLATDDPEVESYFKTRFPDIIFTHDKTYGRNTKEGMIDAVVDLFLLSKTEKIYGSYWSSYSGIASLLGDIELEELHE